MADGAHDVNLMAVIVDGVAHGFSINGQAFVVLTIGLVPSLQGLVEMHGVHADQYFTDDRQTRYDVSPFHVSAAKTFTSLLSKAIGPIRDSQVPAHPAQGCPGDDG